MTQRDPAEELSPDQLAAALERDGDHDTAKPSEGDGQFNSQDMPATDGEFVDASDSESETEEENGYGEYEARNFGEPE
jgi:hypothetical protein